PSIFFFFFYRKKGGHFQIAPDLPDWIRKQIYFPNTNVLITRFSTDQGVAEIIDFMPVGEICNEHVLIRRVTCVKGEIELNMRCAPRFHYGLHKHEVKQEGERFFFVDEKGLTMRLMGTVAMRGEGQDVVSRFVLKPDEKADFIFEQMCGQRVSHSDSTDFIDRSLEGTIQYWKQWVARSQYRGRWQEVVNRSALVLKLMTSRKHGSMVAAPTFSFPELVGGDKNWDYRFNWVRDAAFSLYALIRLGYTEEAHSFMNWFQEECYDLSYPGFLRLMYRLDGSLEMTETTLDHFEGYRQSGPVRIGNAAFDQKQLDIYGELMDSIYLYDKYCQPISHDFWMKISQQIDWLADQWDQVDEGIWEVRGGQQHFLFSRLMCWVAFDRATRLARKRSFPMHQRWIEERDKIYHQIFTDFWDEKRQTFLQRKGGLEVDASTLLMPLVRFISPTDPKWLSTLQQIEKDLVCGPLVYRYRTDAPTGMNEDEGSFSLCSFWYIECLSRSGQLEKARVNFEKMLSYANHVGLYSEELGFHGEHLGNFPQAFTHLSLISAAFDLNRRLG
ncbi:MAG: glycoside hydrolase family 15 protein, partial [Chlamydiia bacterium]|nr:glycoside hydrolase family 15 protein [Chlamydiia bacterium]